MTKNDLSEIRQRDAKGFSETLRQWSTTRIEDTPAQMASDRHKLLAYVDELLGRAHEPKCPCGTAFLRVEGGYVPVCSCHAKATVQVEPGEIHDPYRPQNTADV